MPRGRKRHSGLELNFDGLTDSVTNLVGALILLVVLIIGVTREAISQPKEPAPPPKNVGQKDAGERSIRPLERRVVDIETQIKQAEGDIQAMKADISRLRNEVDALLQKAKQIKPPKPPPPPPEKDKPEKVLTAKYRLPRRDVVLKESLTFIVEDGRISWMDWTALNVELRRQIAGKDGPVNLDFNVPGTDYKVQGSLRVRDGHPLKAGLNLKAVRRQGARGEPLSTITQADSTFQRKLKSVNPGSYVITFLVYPDSFEAFRKARYIAFQQRFRVGWELKKSGSAIVLGEKGLGTGVD